MTQFQFSKQWLLLPRQLMLERMHLLLWQTLRNRLFNCCTVNILAYYLQTQRTSLSPYFLPSTKPTATVVNPHNLYHSTLVWDRSFMFFLLLSEGVLKNSHDFSDCKPHFYTFLVTFIILIIFNLALSHQSGFGSRGSN